MNSTPFKKSLSILTLGIMGLAAGSAQAGWGDDHGYHHGPNPQMSRMFGEKINQRQEQQMERIQAGFRNGKLTQREYRELVQEQRHIREMERHFRADDGRIDLREYQKLDRALDIASRNIMEEKQDRQARGGYAYHPWYN
ncbi:MAG: hypothetical protein AB1593_03015 [Pseudomonadota bacterium]